MAATRQIISSDRWRGMRSSSYLIVKKCKRRSSHGGTNLSTKKRAGCCQFDAGWSVSGYAVVFASSDVPSTSAKPILQAVWHTACSEFCHILAAYQNHHDNGGACMFFSRWTMNPLWRSLNEMQHEVNRVFDRWGHH